eukprot:Gb_32374 [translate_table: standard]
MGEVDVDVEDAMEELFPAFQIDPDYEFSAPHYFDFIQGETREESEKAERWFETAGSYAASPYLAKIKQRESLPDETICSLQEAQHVGRDCPATDPDISTMCFEDANSNQRGDLIEEMELCTMECSTPRKQDISIATGETAQKGPSFASKSTLTKPTASYLAKQVHSGVHGAREVKSAKQVKARRTQDILLKKQKSAEKSAAQENQAVKRQKLEGGRLRQVLNVKEQPLPHKAPSKLFVSRDLSAATEKTVDDPKERQYISTAKVRRFQTKAPEWFQNRPLCHDDDIHGIPQQAKLKLTIPKEPALGTAQRSRPLRVKSTAELEEEMLAKMPKFKARPLNKKILEAPSLPLLQKSAPQLPDFQEFNLKTLERAMQHSGIASSMPSSTDSTLIAEKHQHKSASEGGLTEPRMPHLETALRARPLKVKSSEELEQEELEKIPKFKARPLNHKIFSSRGDLGIFRNSKRQVTTPVEFHFSTDERCHQCPTPIELFSKLSLNSEPNEDLVPRPAVPQLTVPQPFHLLTEERGAEKERKFMLELLQNEQKEQEARIPKANPLPYTIDYPIIPPKPEPRECTKPEPFQLESLMRHEEELQRMMEDRARAEKKETERRKFRAQPNMCNAPVYIPEVPRKPLTEVQEFTFHVDARAVDREEFDKKVIEKQNMYKRFREEYEAAKKVEEERAIKIMRKAMVPHARPMPLFNKPFAPQRSSKELTEPKSPNTCAPHQRDQSWLSTLSVQKRPNCFKPDQACRQRQGKCVTTK